MADIGDKFILEIGGYFFSEIAGGYDTGHEVDKEMLDSPAKIYRVKGFRTLVFDEASLSKLERLEKSEEIGQIAAKEYERGYNEGKNTWDYAAGFSAGMDTNAYQKGMKDAWDAAYSISIMTADEKYAAFETAPRDNPYECLTAQEAIEKICHSKKPTKKSYCIGDEVFIKTENNLHLGTILELENDYCTCIDDNGEVGRASYTDIEATGKNYPGVRRLLHELQDSDTLPFPEYKTEMDNAKEN